MRPMLVATIVALLLLPFIARADDACTSNGSPAAGVVEITGGTADTTAYLDDRNVATGNGVYVYLESNTIWSPKLPGIYVGSNASPDLQRGESWCNGVFNGPPFCSFDACTDPSDIYGPDAEIFSAQR
jgi:hypothetical protein